MNIRTALNSIRAEFPNQTIMYGQQVWFDARATSKRVTYYATIFDVNSSQECRQYYGQTVEEVFKNLILGEGRDNNDNHLG